MGNNQMKIGIGCDPYGKTYGRYGNDKFSIIKQHGYDAVDYTIADTNTELYSLNEEDLKQKAGAEKTFAQSAGIMISQAHGPWCWPPPDGSEQERAARLEEMKKAVIITSLLGCKNLVIHPIMPYGIEDLKLKKEQETWDLNIAFFRKLAAFAKQNDVVICLENMPMRDFSIATPERILEFVKEINDEYLQICLDTGHVSVFPDLSVGNEIRRLGGYIKALHIHDNKGDDDTHLYPTKGIIDWSDFVDALEEIGYSGVLSLETAPPKEYDDTRFEQESMALYKLVRKLFEKHNNNI